MYYIFQTLYKAYWCQKFNTHTANYKVFDQPYFTVEFKKQNFREIQTVHFFINMVTLKHSNMCKCYLFIGL